MVRCQISFPFISLSKTPVPKGFWFERVPPFKFWRRLNEPHGNAKCHICFPTLADKQSSPKVASLRMSWFATTLPFRKISKLWRVGMFPRSRKTFVNMPCPANISLNDQWALAGWLPFAWDSHVVEVCRELASLSRHETSSGLSCCFGCCVTSFHRVFLLLRFWTCFKLLPRTDLLMGFGRLLGDGIFFPLEGWSAGLAADFTQIRCRVFCPARDQPSDFRINRFNWRDELLPFDQAPAAARESTTSKHLNGCRQLWTTSTSSLWIIFSSSRLICCLW